MPEEMFVFCEGVGCVLRDRCFRYVAGERIDRSASGYIWISGCQEEERPMYYPLAKVQKP